MPKLKTQTVEPKTAEDMRPGGNAWAMLYSFVQRYERLQEEKEALAADQREIMEEAKGTGFDTKVMRMAMRRRNMDTADREEMDAMLDLYEEAIKRGEAAEFDKSKDDGE